ncbi:hypothetical protein GCM10010478_11850 [Streptomyces erythrogriseus]|uniref:Uncharacterized protein n=2 Tax=Streptomyces griseoincarnatus group TaxID=2867193 RepID=A0ABN3WI87_9ACTN|nr:hypothetical protein GCM10010265_12580 [Streptomyces griseoincarnatus]GGT67670.1 hypothetical protein GCM10010287_47800 [Streptomyces variabilis]
MARRLKDGMAHGVPSFPLTSFHDRGTLAPDGYRAHVAERIAAGSPARSPAPPLTDPSARDLAGPGTRLDAGLDLVGAAP